ncbi:MAG: ABC transporter ATP-binding protein/permease [Lentilactobacillus buchneri]|nr:ABC transporter ATP-binding protein/permease [Lentilactobacillus buchneri]MCI2019698.1 ABC transporter ATP-binding protein/permease [Lentilactobacillus buchneri]MCI2028126.1 ABC transporter ATP-binding protein/permease [Lentilactobacillus buchneri]
MNTKHQIRLYNMSAAFMFGIILNLIGSLIGVVLPLVIRKVIDLRSALTQHAHWQFMLIILLMIITNTITDAFSGYLISKAGDQQIAKIRMEVQSHLLTLPISFFDNTLSGRLTSRVINDALIIKSFMVSSIPSGLNSILTIVGSFLVLFFLDWKLSLIILISFPVIVLFAWPLGRINERISTESQKRLSELSGISTDALRNVRVIKLNNAQENVLKRFKENVLALYHVSIKADKIYAITGPIQTSFTLMVILSIILYGGLRVSEGTLTIGTLVSFLIYLFQMVSPINIMANFYSNYTQARGATSKINEIINTPSEQSEYNQSKQLIKTTNPELVLKNVTFSYKDQVVLQNINMKFESHKKIAIVGPSGAGKTTIINLITRLYPLQKGEIYLNGQDSIKINLEEWRSMFGVVTQENSVLSGTIYSNLVFGLKTVPSKMEISEAIKVANLTKDIKKMPNGIKTVVGEQGVKLSGGQRQRLQIARAYLKNPQFLILDEATSSLDSDSEKAVSDALDNIMKNKTIITIAHRLSTVTDSDRIYFVDNKTIIDSGTHEELLNKVPQYKKFVEEQLLVM